MTFAPADFRGLETFEYAWRWTSEQYDVLPEEVLRTIRPLVAPAARRVGNACREYCAERPVREFDLTVAAEYDLIDSVRTTLERLPIPPDAEIVVSWSTDIAVVTTWATLSRYWSAFCYPSSDDVTVWTPGGPWALCYRHFQVFQFRRLAVNSREHG